MRLADWRVCFPDILSEWDGDRAGLSAQTRLPGSSQRAAAAPGRALPAGCHTHTHTHTHTYTHTHTHTLAFSAYILECTRQWWIHLRSLKLLCTCVFFTFLCRCLMVWLSWLPLPPTMTRTRVPETSPPQSAWCVSGSNEGFILDLLLISNTHAVDVLVGLC